MGKSKPCGGQLKEKQLKVFNLSLSYSDYILVDSNVSNFKKSFLIDSQADITLIKSSAIDISYSLNTNNLIKIKGITSDSISSLGTTLFEFYVGSLLMRTQIHVVPDTFNIPTDGILGRDFLKHFRCSINYDKMTCEINPPDDKSVVIPILNNFNDHLIIPPRCEVRRIFKLHVSNKNEEYFIPEQELIPGVHIPRTLVKTSENNSVVIPVLNTTEDIQTIPNNININKIRLSEFNVLQVKTELNESRVNEIISIVSENTDKAFQSSIQKLCRNFADIFALDTDKLSTNNFYEQKLRVTDNIPVYQKNYRLPYSQKEEVDNQVKNLLENDLIEPSSSNFNSPIILVPKKGNTNKWRMCIDYRLVNKKLIADKYPLPRIDEILDSLGRSKYFSVLDLHSGFHQIPIEESSRDITSFSTNQGSFRYKVLPFGLNISPNSFTRMMNLAFAGLTPDQCFIYMDDIIVTGCSEKHHLSNLSNVFATCRKYNLKLKPSKCQFFKKEVMYIGHVVNENGVSPDPEKVKAVENYPIPTNKDEVRRFVAFMNFYRRFIPNFAEIAKPLNQLTQKKRDFIWTDVTENSFQSLRAELLKYPILRYPDFNQEFCLVVDASKYAVGACLMQKVNGTDHPISYASRSFTKGELNKSTIEKELAAIHFAILHFRPYLYGRHFKVLSDHKPLTYLFSLKNPSSKLTRMRMDLEEYNFCTEFIKGTSNVIADALSRITIEDLKNISDKLNNSNLNVLPVQTRQMKKLQSPIIKDIPNNCCNSSKNQNRNDQSAIQNNKTILNNNEESSNINNNDKVKFANVRDIRIPKLETTLRANDLCISVKFNHKDICDFVVNVENLTLVSILDKIEKRLLKTEYKVFELGSNDALLMKYSIDTFMNQGNKYLKQIIIIICNDKRKIINESEKLKILKTYHDNPIFGGHMSKQKLLSKLKENFYWKNMAKDVYNFTERCKICQMNKLRTRKKEPMYLTETPNGTFVELVIDTIGPFNTTIEGFRYALTVICNLSKFLIIIPIKNKEANTIAQSLIENCILPYGLPKVILSDRGTEYANSIFKEICLILDITHNMSTAYHHETLGVIERSHRTLNNYLRCYINDNQNNWDIFVKYFAFCYNITPHDSFNQKFTPFELMFGRKVNFPESLGDDYIKPVYNFDNYAKIIENRFQLIHKIAKELLEESKFKSKMQYDKYVKPLDFKINDLVLLKKEIRNKLDPPFEGPFLVTEITGLNVSIKDISTSKEQIVHKNRLINFIE